MDIGSDAITADFVVKNGVDIGSDAITSDLVVKNGVDTGSNALTADFVVKNSVHRGSHIPTAALVLGKATPVTIFCLLSALINLPTSLPMMQSLPIIPIITD